MAPPILSQRDYILISVLAISIKKASSTVLSSDISNIEMKNTACLLYGGFMSFLLIAMPKSVSCLQSRKGFFNDDIDPSTLQSSKTIELATIDVPSDLACSQKCFANELCSYKSYDANSGKCQLYKQISSDDVKHRKRIAMKVNVSLSSTILIKMHRSFRNSESANSRRK